MGMRSANEHSAPPREDAGNHDVRRLHSTTFSRHRDTHGNNGVGRARVTTVAVVLAILAILAGAVIITTITRAHVNLDDGTVWVTSLKDHKAARFNVKIKDANAAVTPKTARFDVAQSGEQTVLLDGGRAQSILASTLGPHGSSEMKNSTTTFMGGPTVAFLNTQSGNVWTGRSSDMDSISPTTASPQMQLGTGGKVAVTHEGAVYGYRPGDGVVLKMDGPNSPARTFKSLTDGRRSDADSFTVIGDTPVISVGRRLMWPGGSGTTKAIGRLTLQAAPTDDSQRGWAAASASNGIFTVDLHHGTTKDFITSGKAQAAQPVSTDGCVYGAWSQSSRNYVRLCSAEGGEGAADAKATEFSTLQSVSPTSQLVFRTNHRQVVLNDVSDGKVWNPNESPKAMRIQWRKLQAKKVSTRERDQDTANNQTQFKPNCSTKSGSIKAQDDTFGVRAGSEQILDVLRNDEQSDCSIITISKIGPVQGSGITVSPIYSGRYLQLDATGAKAGKSSFSYEIDDGKGQTSQATVTLDIESATANKPPVQGDTPPEYDVEQGASLTVNALGGFTDPEGDPLTLVSATPENSDQVTVSTRADGQLVFNAGSVSSGRVGVTLTVSDGQATGTGSIYFSIRRANTLPALIDAVVQTTAPGMSTTVNLKPYVHGTSSEPPTLTSVESPTGSSTYANPADLSFTFSSDTPGTYTVPYTISQGSVTAQGLARVEVRAANDESAKPVAANDVALLGADHTAIVEPLNNDVDPLGGVLAVTSVDADPSLGIKTGLVAHKRVYMTARQIPTRPAKINYTVSNSVGSSKGTIVLQPPTLTASNSAPKAANITANVRTGGIISLDILDHVSHSDGTTVKLNDDLQYDRKTFKGLVFVSGDNVRYQAPEEAGVYRVTYTVQDNLGNAASGLISITVHSKNAQTKSPPTPQDVQAQVAAGQKVRIPITMTGIDQDGDDDTLLGLGNKAPKLGRIDEVGANYIVYEAYNDSSGTDTFSYAVEDWTGQRAQAQVRVGVFTGSTDSGVYARDDQVTLRPNKKATVPVTLNDISGDNTDLKISKTIEAQGIQGATVEDNSISFTTPQTPGVSYIIYTVHDKAGLSDTATLTITSDPKAPIDPPIAYDYRVPSSATIDKKTVDVDLSPWIANPSGTAGELRIGVDPSVADHAHVKEGKDSTTLSVDLTDEARSVPYTVTNTTYNVRTTAFVQVPAYGVFPPTLRPKAPALRVNAKQSITINIADYVRVGAGKSPHVDKDSVSATKSANSDYFVNDQTLRFTAPKDYAGPASITFDVADGVREKGRDIRKVDKNGNVQAKIINSSTLTLPITVIGRNVPPPTFSSSTVSVVAGEDAKTIDLKALTHAPGGLDPDETEYTYSGAEVSGPVTAHLGNGGRLTIRAAEDAPVGSMTSIPLNIKYTNGTVNTGITAQVVQSTRPLAQIQGVRRQIKAGDSETVNVLSDAFNPFPGKPLTVTDCRSDDSAKLKVDCGASGSVTIHAASDIGASTNTVVVTVQDATKTRERQVSGTITLSVIDKPAPPLLSPVSGKPTDGAVNLSWTPGSANGSPITEYRADWDGGGKSCGAVTTCNITGLTNGKEYHFTVKAKNEAGWSKPSESVYAKPDKVPDPPSSIRLEGGYKTIDVSWSRPDYTGTAPDSYTVTLNGVSKVTTGLSTSFTLDNGAITGSYAVTVQGHNRAGDGPVSAPAQMGDENGPWGDPDAPVIADFSSQNDGRTMNIGVYPGASLRNAGCSSIAISGAFGNHTLPCQGGNVSVNVSRNQYNRPQTITATLMARKNGAQNSHSQATATPTYAIRPVQGLHVNRNGNTCKALWHGDGDYDSFVFNGMDIGNTTERSYSINEWSSCGRVTLVQKLNGVTGSTPVTVDASGDVYKVPAAITPPTLTWDGNDPDLIRINGGSINLWGQSGTVQIVIDGRPYSWAGDRLDVHGLPAGRYQWKVIVTGATDSALNNTAEGGTPVQGFRNRAGAMGARLSLARAPVEPFASGIFVSNCQVCEENTRETAPIVDALPPVGTGFGRPEPETRTAKHCTDVRHTVCHNHHEKRNQ